jgi:hypothetical protein
MASMLAEVYLSVRASADKLASDLGAARDVVFSAVASMAEGLAATSLLKKALGNPAEAAAATREALDDFDKQVDEALAEGEAKAAKSNLGAFLTRSLKQAFRKDALGGALDEAAKGWRLSLSGLVAAVGDMGGALKLALVGGLGSVLGPALKALAGGLAAGGAAAARGFSEAMLDALMRVEAGMGAAAVAVQRVLGEAWARVGQTASAVWPRIRAPLNAFVNDARMGISVGLLSAFSSLVSAVAPALKPLGDAVRAAWGGATGFLAAPHTAVAVKAVQIFDALTAAARTSAAGVGDSFTNMAVRGVRVWDEVTSAARAAWGMMVSGTTSAAVTGVRAWGAQTQAVSTLGRVGTAVAVRLVQTWDALSAAVRTVMAGPSAVITAVAVQGVRAWDTLGSAVTAAAVMGVRAWDALALVPAKLSAAWGGFTSLLGRVWDNVRAGAAAAGRGFAAAWGVAGAAAVAMARGVSAGITGLGRGILAVVDSKAGTAFFLNMDLAVRSVIASARRLASGVFNIGASAAHAGASISNFIGAAILALPRALAATFSLLGSVGGYFAKALAPLGRFLRDALGGGVMASLGDLGTMFSAIAGTAGSLLSGAFKAAAAVGGAAFRVLGGVLTALGATAGAVANVIMGAWSGALGALGGIAHGIFNVFGALFRGVFDAATALATGIRDAFQSLLTAAAALTAQALSAVAGMARVALSALDPLMKAFDKPLTDLGNWVGYAAQGEAMTARINAQLMGTGQVAGWSAEQLEKMARNLADLGTHDINQIREAQAMLLRFTHVQGEYFTRSLDATRQLSVVLGITMTEAARQLGMALQNPLQGLQGMRTLKGAGVMFTPIEKEFMKTAMAAGKLQEAQDLLLTKITHLGPAAETFGATFQGVVQYLRVTWTHLGNEIGKALLPWVKVLGELLIPLVQGFSQTVTGFIDSISGEMEGGAAVASQWIKENLDVIRGWGASAGRAVIAVIEGIRAAFVMMGDVALNAFRFLTGDPKAGMEDLKNAATDSMRIIAAAAENPALVWRITMGSMKISWLSMVDYLKQAWSDFGVWFDYQARVMNVSFAKTILSAAAKIGDMLAGIGITSLSDSVNRTLEGIEEKVRKPKYEELPENPEIERRRKARQISIDELLKKAGEIPEEVPRARTRKEDLGAPTPGGIEQMVENKFRFEGLADYAKRFQESIVGSPMESLARLQVEETRGVKENVTLTNDHLQRIVEAQRQTTDAVKSGMGFRP